MYAYASALEECMNQTKNDDEDVCVKNTTMFVKKYLTKQIQKDANQNYSILNYRIKEDGATGYETIGKCDTIHEDLNCMIESSAMAGSCNERQVLEPDRYNQNCPKTCRTCRDYEYKVDETCKECDIGQYVNHSSTNESKCYKLTSTYPLTLTHPSVIILWLMTFLGLILTMLVIAIFIKYRDTPMVRITHGYRPLLIGITIMFLDTFVELERPSSSVCFLRRFVLGIGLTIVYGTLFMRGLSRYRIQHALLEERKSHFAQVKTQRLLLLVLLSIQIVISVIWCIIEYPKMEVDWFERTSKPGIERCNTNEIARFTSQAYNFILITVGTYFAIRTRNIQGAFGEAKWIFHAMTSNWVLGSVFAAVHYTNLNDYAVQRVALCFTTSLSGFLYLFIMFLPKIYIILLKPERNVMCDDMEELEHSEAELESDNGIEDDDFKDSDNKRLPQIKEEVSKNETDLIQRAEATDEVKAHSPSSPCSPDQKLLPTEVIVHSPE